MVKIQYSNRYQQTDVRNTTKNLIGLRELISICADRPKRTKFVI